ncbi:Anaphase-promoting complex subunit 7 [Linnemannia zychae]|nr:Anaphase-promoting complex subunit 7 [Linnemannia zychae]
MAAGNRKPYTPQERLEQLQVAESLYDAGLYKSTLLITGIHLSTVRKDEKWFEVNALYRKAAYIEETSPPSELLKPQLRTNDSGTNSTADNYTKSESAAPSTRLSSHPISRGMEMFKLFTEGKEEMNKDRENRGQLVNALIATARNSLAKPALRESAQKTKPVPPPIPSVKPLSATMSKQFSIYDSADDEHIRKKQLISIEQPPIESLQSLGEISSTKSVTTKSGILTSESIKQDPTDIMMDHAFSCFESGDYSRSRELLLQIPEEKRTVKTYLLLIQLLHKKTNLQILEDTYWTEIAKLQPLAIEAYIHMLRAGKPLFFVVNMIPRKSLEHDWMRIYLQGMESYYSMKYEAAYRIFSKLDEAYPQNIDLKLRLARCLKWMGKYVRACLMYSQVRKLDNYIVDDMYYYGACLKEIHNTKYLNKLAGDLLNFNDKHPDTWCVQAMYWDMKNERDKALQLVSRALQYKPDHCGALQLRGLFYLERSPVKAIGSFREASKVEKDIVTYEGMVRAYVQLERQLEACKEAEEAKSRMPGNAQAHALYGMALYHTLNDDAAQDAQAHLIEALRIDPGCDLAAETLIKIYEGQKRYEEAIELLDQQIDYQPPDNVHIKKALIYKAMERWEEALSSYERARSFNPDNITALEGVTYVEKCISGGDEDVEDEHHPDDDLEIDEMDIHQDESSRVQGELDEDDILTGEEEHGEEYEDDHSHRMQSPQYTPHQSQRNGSGFTARALAQQPQEEQFHNRQHPMPVHAPSMSNRAIDSPLFTPRQGQQYISLPHQQQRQHQNQLQYRQQQYQEQQQRYVYRQQDNMPSSSGYPQTPSRSMVSQTSYTNHQRRLNSQREREYDDQDGRDNDMED